MRYTLSFIVLITDGLYEQIIPQSVCSRYGLAIGSTVAPFVRVLVWICFPVAYPISKVITVFSYTIEAITWAKSLIWFF